MKLSEQYKRKLNELTSTPVTAVSKPRGSGAVDGSKPQGLGVADDGSRTDGSKPQGLAPAFSTYDIHSYITYGYISIAILSLIFGKRVFNKLGISSKINKPGLIARIRDKKGLKRAGLTDDEIRDIWIRGNRTITALDHEAIYNVYKQVKKGKITAAEAMSQLGDIVPRGNKTANYKKFKTIEDKALIKKNAKKSIKPNISFEDINPTNVTKDQFLKLRPNQILALKANPALTYGQLSKY